MRKLLILFFLLCMSGLGNLNAQQKSDRLRPRWLTSSLPVANSASYIFLDASGIGNTLEEARQRSFLNLSTKLEHERGIKVNSSMKVNSQAIRQGGEREQKTYQSYQMECVEKGKELVMTTRIVDEYWERDSRGYTCYVLCGLHTVTDNKCAGGSYEDEIRLTTSYGAKGFFYSLIPGVGQLYKGSKLKGGLILGGTAACAGMIVVAENQRSTYIKKMREKPKFKEFYSDKAGNWENVRNGFIGAAAALYVYNLIDAAVAPGRRRVIVEQNQRVHVSFIPAWSIDGVGMSLVMNF